MSEHNFNLDNDGINSQAEKLERKLEKHHVIPRSRGGRDEDGVCYVDHTSHVRYHQLFNNMTPPEIMDYLIRVFWDHRTDLVMEYLDGYFKNKYNNKHSHSERRKK